MNARQRQVAAILGRRRRQVERVTAQIAFNELAQIAPGDLTEVQLFGQQVRLLPGTEPLLGYRIGSPALPTPAVVFACVYVRDADVALHEAQAHLDHLHKTQLRIAPDAEAGFLTTLPTLHSMKRRLEPALPHRAWQGAAFDPGPVVD